MGALLEISTVNECRVFFEKTSNEQERYFFSAYVQLPDHTQFILDDRQLPRLKQRIGDVLAIVSSRNTVIIDA